MKKNKFFTIILAFFTITVACSKKDQEETKPVQNQIEEIEVIDKVLLLSEIKYYPNNIDLAAEIEYSYDEKGRVVEESVKHTLSEIEDRELYDYDSQGRLVSGRLVTVIDRSAQVDLFKFHYDSNGKFFYKEIFSGSDDNLIVMDSLLSYDSEKTVNSWLTAREIDNEIDLFMIDESAKIYTEIMKIPACEDVLNLIMSHPEILKSHPTKHGYKISYDSKIRNPFYNLPIIKRGVENYPHSRFKIAGENAISELHEVFNNESLYFSYVIDDDINMPIEIKTSDGEKFELKYKEIEIKKKVKRSRNPRG